ncbi:MAG: flagellar protein FlaG [Gammaproteobacteria bacterium]|nr:flagellar protein FlaG [Gammaproteobacteria bacterium]
MTTPVDNNSVSSLPSQFSYQAARQRVEKVLAQLPAAGGAVQESDSEGRMVEREELVKPVQQINEVLRRYGVEFQLSEDSGRTIIRLIDRENGELIRQIPPEEALNAAQRLEEVKGRLFSLEV